MSMARLPQAMRFLSIALIVLLGLVIGAPAGVHAAPRPSAPAPHASSGKYAAIAYSLFSGSSDKYAAIAYSPYSGHWGRSWNYSNRTDAENRALDECFNDTSITLDCRIVASIHYHRYAALASARNGAWGAAYGDTLEQAKLRAIERCNYYGGDSCSIRTTVSRIGPV